ncbi:hypothetical protein ACMFMG_008946 [Clarireedia jacksonii]
MVFVTPSSYDDNSRICSLGFNWQNKGSKMLTSFGHPDGDIEHIKAIKSKFIRKVQVNLKSIFIVQH